MPRTLDGEGVDEHEISKLPGEPPSRQGYERILEIRSDHIERSDRLFRAPAKVSQNMSAKRSLRTEQSAPYRQDLGAQNDARRRRLRQLDGAHTRPSER